MKKYNNELIKLKENERERIEDKCRIILMC